MAISLLGALQLTALVLMVAKIFIVCTDIYCYSLKNQIQPVPSIPVNVFSVGAHTMALASSMFAIGANTDLITNIIGLNHAKGK